MRLSQPTLSMLAASIDFAASVLPTMDSSTFIDGRGYAHSLPLRSGAGSTREAVWPGLTASP